MPGAITTYAVDSSAPVNVVCVQSCTRVEVRENVDMQNNLPTTALKQFKPKGASNFAIIPQGENAVFEDFVVYNPGTIVGQIQTVSGSITVVQIESGIGSRG
jgi:hypothetical protein